MGRRELVSAWMSAFGKMKVGREEEDRISEVSSIGNAVLFVCFFSIFLDASMVAF